jgi:hypothetical protein
MKILGEKSLSSKVIVGLKGLFTINFVTPTLVLEDSVDCSDENLNIVQHTITMQIINKYLIICFKIFLFIYYSLLNAKSF